MESNLDKDIKKEENNDNKEDNNNIDNNENNKEIDNIGEKKNFENLDDNNNNINMNSGMNCGMLGGMLGGMFGGMNNVNMNNSQGCHMMQMCMNPCSNPFLSPNEREYYNYCKDLSFIDKDNKITVKVNQKFAEKCSNNYTVPPQFWKDIPSVQSKSEGIEYIETRSFYPHPNYLMGGESVTLIVFKATKKGKFKINFPNYTVDVNVIE